MGLIAVKMKLLLAALFISTGKKNNDVIFLIHSLDIWTDFIIDLLCFLVFPDFSLCLKIHQAPSAFSRVGDQTVILQCDQDSSEYYYMYWYRQSSSKTMQLLTYSLNKGIVKTEPPYNESKYAMTRPDVLSTSLQIHLVEAADSAVYYCASSLTMVQKASAA